MKVLLLYSVWEGGAKKMRGKGRKMADKIRKSDVKILASTIEEINAEYVWTNCIDEEDGGSYFKIKVGNKVCCVRVRFADKNFRRNYSDSTRCIQRYQIRDDDQFIVMSEHYRNKCGGLKSYISGGKQTYDVELVKMNQIVGEFLACWYFPTYYVRWEIILSAIGIILGAISLFCSIWHRQHVVSECSCCERIHTPAQFQVSNQLKTTVVSPKVD